MKSLARASVELDSDYDEGSSTAMVPRSQLQGLLTDSRPSSRPPPAPPPAAGSPPRKEVPAAAPVPAPAPHRSKVPQRRSAVGALARYLILLVLFAAVGGALTPRGRALARHWTQGFRQWVVSVMPARQ
jgi:hypothetical protein